MQIYYHYFPALSLLSGLILISLGVFSLFRRRIPGTGLFSLLMFAGADIAVFYFFEVACVDLKMKYLFIRMQFFGTATLSVFWLLLAAYFSGFRKILSAKYILPLFIIPVITIIIVWTNHFHFLFWSEIGLGRAGDILYMDNTFGYWGWVHLFYLYSTYLIGSVILIRHAVKSKGLLRSQSIAFLIAALFPWLLNVFFSLNIFSLVQFDVSPLTFVFAGAALWWAIFRYHLLDIMPAAKDAVLENIRAGLIVTDLRKQVVEINSFITEIFGIEPKDVVGMPIRLIWKKLGIEFAGSGAQGDAGPEGEIGFVKGEYEYYYEIEKTPIINSKGLETGRLILIFDVTEKRKAEELLYQSQKVEALGRLSDGIAHEFNNILTIVYNYSNYRDKENVQEIHSAVKRGQELTKQLLTFSRKRIVEKDLIPLSSVIDGMSASLRDMVKKTTEIIIREESNPGVVLANRHQIEQMIVNLVKNADDAMPGGGMITILIGIVNIQEGRVRDSWMLAPGPYTFIRITDTGTGISDTIREHIFDPFFTTKDVGKGRGLGLSSVYGIVRQYKGRIDLQTEIGAGSSFTVYLPSYSCQE